MHTASLETTHAFSLSCYQMLFAGGGGLGPQMSKFGQISNDQHQMSQAEGRYQGPVGRDRVTGPQVWCPEGEGRVPLPCNLFLIPLPPWIACENITLPQLSFHVVINVCADDWTAH